MSSVKTISDRDLLRRLNELVGKERHAEADLLIHLAEVQLRELYLEEGCSSMYRYCIDVLRFSEAVAAQRIRAARVARAFPILLERLRWGEIHLAGVSVLATHLTEDNHVELLDRARHRTRNAIEQMVADLAPKPEAPSLVRRLPETGRGWAPAVRQPTRDPSGGVHSAPEPPAPTRPPRYERRTPEPLGRERFKIQFTASQELCDKLREAQALLRHKIPNGELAQIFDRALTLLVEDVKRKKFAQTPRPAKRRQVSGDRPSRYIPAEIKRAVYARDGGSCAFVGRNGRRCGERDRLELHHLDPWARSGSHSVGGIELRCQQHNLYEAQRDFGARYMARFRKSSQGMLPRVTVPGNGNARSHSPGPPGAP